MYIYIYTYIIYLSLSLYIYVYIYIYICIYIGHAAARQPREPVGAARRSAVARRTHAA